MSEVNHEESTPAQSPAETEARLFGWKPLEEFHGDPARWRDADAFLEKGRQINGFLRKDFDKLRQELHVRDSQIADLQRSIAQFAEYHQETEARALERARKELKAERKEALRAQDGERVVEIEERLESLDEAAVKMRAAPPVVATKLPAGPDPVFKKWIDENSWYTENRVLRALTHDYAEELKQTNPQLLGVEFLEQVKRRVQADHPEFFQNPARSRPSAVGTGSAESSPRSTRGKSYADLPVEARITCDKFVKQGFVTRESYVRDYFGDEAA